MHFVYIIHSPSFDKYYIGETEDLDQRIGLHNSGTFESSATRFAKDWSLAIAFKVLDRSEARKLEAYIKGMKSKQFIRSLIKDEEFQRVFRQLCCICHISAF